MSHSAPVSEFWILTHQRTIALTAAGSLTLLGASLMLATPISVQAWSALLALLGGACLAAVTWAVGASARSTRHTLAAAGLGVWRLDRRKRRLHLDTGAARLLGLMPSERMLDLEHLLALVHEEDREPLAAALSSPRLNVAAMDLQIRLSHTPGEVIVLGLRGGPVAGGLVLAGVFEDLTKRHDEERRREQMRAELAERNAGLALRLQMYKTRVRQHMDQTPDGICIVRAGRVHYVNPAALAILGFPDAEAVAGKSPLQFIHPDEHIRHASSIRSLMEEVPILPYEEWRFASRHGLDLKVSACMFRMHHDRESYMLLFRDSTAHRRAEAELRLSQERIRWLNESLAEEVSERTDALRLSEGRYRTLVQATTQDIFIADAKGRIKTHIKSSLGRDMSGLQGLAAFRFMHPEDRDAFQSQYREHIRTDSMFQAMCRMLHKDGSWHHLRITLCPLRDAQGVTQEWIGTGEDVTKQVAAQFALVASEQRYRTLILATAHGVWTLDTEGNFIDMPATITNRTVEEMRGRKWLSLVHEDDLPHVEARINQALFSRAPVSWTCRTWNKAGQLRHVESRIAPIFDNSGKVVEWIGVTGDVTQTEEARRRLEESEDQLRQLTARLVHVREQEQTRIAREIHDELGAILTAVKFDLGWLVKYSTNDQRARKLSSSALELVDHACRSVKRICSDLRPSLLDQLGLGAALDWLCREWQQRTHVSCELQSSFAEEPALPADLAVAIYRIVQEALTNVFRHARASRCVVRMDQEGGMLSVEVCDDGMGLPPGAPTRRGTMGLLSMRERARMHDGEIEFGNCEPRGARLSARFPMPVSSELPVAKAT